MKTKKIEDIEKTIKYGKPDEATQTVFSLIKGCKITKKEYYPLSGKELVYVYPIHDISDINYNGKQFYFIGDNEHCEELRPTTMAQMVVYGLSYEYSAKEPFKMAAWYYSY